MRDKREIVAECLQANPHHPPSADAILNALHQGGWQVTPKSSSCTCVQVCGDTPEDSGGTCKGLPGFVS